MSLIYLFGGIGKNTQYGKLLILTDVAKKVGLEEIGTHTLRKTFGYWHYKQHKDIALLQELFNHSAPSVTLRYIGINQDTMDASLEDFYL